jgi:very-short-patch-repair endonuclease
MISFLDKHRVNYETQKIFYIYAENGWIIRYYIADFFVPSANVIIEVDGKFHDKQKQHDKDRTKTIQQNYPWVQVLRYRWEDFSDNTKMAELLSYVK